MVYRATGVTDGEKYVLKQCKDYGEAEIWTNSRLQEGVPQRHRVLRGTFYGQELQEEEHSRTEAYGQQLRAGRRRRTRSAGSWKFEGSDTPP